jgi:hypothetical protein
MCEQLLQSIADSNARIETLLQKLLLAIKDS